LKFGVDILGGRKSKDEASGSEEHDLFEESKVRVLKSKPLLAVKKPEEAIEDAHGWYINAKIKRGK
jgi:hypothetical protein